MNFEPALDFLGGTVVKTNAGNEETQVRSLDQEDPLE